MGPTGRSAWDWAEAKVGQVLLFWGVLELILRALDALTSSDMLLMLRQALGSELHLFANPRMAVLLVLMALALLWESSRPKRPIKSIIHGLDQAQTANHPILEASAIPFFLAFVCGVSFGAFQWSSPNHGQLARLPSLDLTASLPTASLRRLAPAQSTPASHPAVSAGQTKKAESLLQSAPELTPAIDQQGENADILSGGNPLAANPFYVAPRAPQEGQAVRKAGASALQGSDESEEQALDRMRIADKNKNWQLLAALCEDSIQKDPEWLTPYLFAGEAYANLGRIDRAVDRLEYVEKNGAGNPQYRAAVRQAIELRQSIRQLFGR